MIRLWEVDEKHRRLAKGRHLRLNANGDDDKILEHCRKVCDGDAIVV